MKQSIATLALLTAAIAAASNDKPLNPPAQKTTARKKKTQTKTVAVAKKPAPPVAQPLTIPKDATQNPDGTYSYADKTGKKWIFTKTPFGISRREDMAGVPAAIPAQDKQQFIQATDNGDTVKFVRQTPFGTTNWEKKKSDLNDDERRVLDAQQQPKAQ
jgi:glucose/arabinose dehydrogenase